MLYVLAINKYFQTHSPCNKLFNLAHVWYSLIQSLIQVTKQVTSTKVILFELLPTFYKYSASILYVLAINEYFQKHSPDSRCSGSGLPVARRTYTVLVPDRVCIPCSWSRSRPRFSGSSSRLHKSSLTYTHPPCVRFSGHHCVASSNGTTDGDISPNLRSLVYRRRVARHGRKEGAVEKPLWSHNGNPCLTSQYPVPLHFPLSALLV